jgi:hypothetical protein
VGRDFISPVCRNAVTIAIRLVITIVVESKMASDKNMAGK